MTRIKGLTLKSQPWLITFTLLLFLASFPACQFSSSKKAEQEQDASSESRETKKKTSIFKAIKGIKETAEKAKEMSEREPVEPVHFRELLTVLPEPPSGWLATDKVDARTQQFGEWKASYALKEYKQSGGDGVIQVKVTDGAYIPFLYAAYTMAPAFSEESLDEYKKGIKTDIYTGWEEFHYKRKTGSLNVMLYERYIVEIKARGIDKPEMMQEWLKRIDLNQLKSWAESPTPVKKAR